MLNYKEYLKESQDNQVVVLDDGQGGNMFKTVKNGSKNSIAYLNAVIKRFIESVYGSSGFVSSLSAFFFFFLSFFSSLPSFLLSIFSVALI